ncbi:MAG TPA: PH domain-containing protein [Methanoregula sp.]|nr:PH domain-containing protein [Methanoregula sp.]
MNTPFKPAQKLVSLLIIDSFLFVLLILCISVLPVLAGSGFDLTIAGISAACVIGIIAFIALWANLYYKSMWYELRDDEISWKRGVWFRTTGIVPYNRITNLDVRQGPVMRVLGISTLSIQTAGYSGQAVPEIKIEGVVHAEELRELIRSLVRQCSAANDGTGAVTPKRGVSTPETTQEKILAELVKIRTLLERQ